MATEIQATNANAYPASTLKSIRKRALCARVSGECCVPQERKYLLFKGLIGGTLLL